MANGLKHKERLLEDIAHGLKEHAKNRCSHIRVRFYVGTHPIKEFLGLQPALECLALDLYWDEEGNWADANHAVVDVY